MRKFLMFTTALVGLMSVPVEAQADPVSAVAVVAGAGSLWAAGAATGFAAVALRIGGSLLLNYGAGRIASSMGSTSQTASQVQQAELSRASELPAYRYVYGACWAAGTPVGWNVVGDYLYICYLLNSRPSALDASHKVLFDNRLVQRAGDPFDFSGPGADATVWPFDNHVWYWIGRGDQTGCPQVIVDESDYFEATDAWRGRTVLWAKLKCGDESNRSERWPASPPALNVEGTWSILTDPRTGESYASRNAALVVLDALRNNPLRPYQDAYLWLDSFKEAISRCADLITNKDGSTTARFNCDGTLVWSDGAELEDQLDPLLAAGGLELIRSGGRLGIIAPVYRPSVYTITDFTDTSITQMTRWQPSDQIYTECTPTFTDPGQAYASAQAPTYIAPGAQAADGGVPKPLTLDLPFVTDHRQAQRLAKIAVRKTRYQRRITSELMPDAFVMVAGSRCTADLPAPYSTAFNVEYVVDSIDTAAGVNDDDSITLRLPVVLRETSPTIYAWDAATEEKDMEAAVLSPFVAGVSPPTAIVLTSGGDAALISGSTITPRVGIDLTASTSASAVSYEWQYRIGTGGWQDGGSIDADATLRAWITPVIVGSGYSVRVRTIGLYGRSGWRTSDAITASGPTAVLSAPALNGATGGAGRITLSVTQSDDSGAARIEIWGGTGGSVVDADLLTTRNAGPNVTINWSETGLGDGATRYYWTRARDDLGNVSTYSNRATAVTNS